MVDRRAGVLLLVAVWGCGDAKSKLEGVVDAIGEVDAGAVVRDLPGYASELEDSIRNLDVVFTMHTISYDPATREFQNLTPPEVRRNLFTVTRIGDRIYVLGGLDEDGNYTSALEAYDPATDQWERLADWPHPGFAWVVELGGLLCSIGGYRNLDEPVRREVDCYDPAAGAWFAGDPVPETYSSFHPVAYGGKAYLLGGTDADLQLTDAARSFDPVTSQWTDLAPLPAGRALAGAEAVGDRIYVTGGFGEATFQVGEEDAPQDRGMLVYIPGEDRWEAAPQMPHSRALYGLDSVDGRLAVFFGVTDGPLVEFFDPSAGAWFPGSDPPELPSGGVYTYVNHAEQMHLFVIADELSSSEVSASGALWRYDPAADRWEQVARRSASEEDALFVGASFPDRIYWVGAHTTIQY